MLFFEVAQLFLDCDGVLADFDSAAERIFGQPSRQAEKILGSNEFWRKIRSSEGFFRNLSLLGDAMELYQSVSHLHPIILTGCPKGGWAEEQKKAWAAHYFPGVEVIACLSKDKYLHMKNRGDILVDDYPQYQSLWEKAGGIFIHHHSARESARRLSELGLSVAMRRPSPDP